MKLSVVIPTYNRAAVLRRAVDSVFAQSWLIAGRDLEVIVVNDGSQDDTAAIVLKEYPLVTYLYQENTGVSSARNLGIQSAKGEWVALLDSDDEWLPHKLERQFALLESSGLKVCHTEEIWIRNGKRVNQMRKHAKTGGWIFHQCLPLCAMSPSSIIIHRSVFEQLGGFDESLPACEDYDLWLRLSARYEVVFEATACIHKFGGHADQLSRQYWGMDRFRVLALEKILATQLDAEQREAARDTLLFKLKVLMNGALKRDNHDLAEQCQAKILQWQSV